MPEVLVSRLKDFSLSPLTVILALLVIFLILGSIFDTLAGMVITMPFVLPLVTDAGYHPVWWGIVLVMLIEVGMITPPIGMNVFVLYGVTDRKVPLPTIFKGILPFFCADMARILLVVLFPALALWLPRVAGYSLK